MLLQEASGGREPPESAPSHSPAPSSGGLRPPLAECVPKITGFGLAKHLDRASALTETGRVLGTPEYMAPEQANGRAGAIGPATDVWALGAILYECLTGQPPFPSTGTIHDLLALVTRDAVAPRRLQPGIDRDLETICLKCLEKEPARRYASAGELADDLQRFLAGEPIRARPVGPVERIGKWARRRPVVAGLLAGLVAVSVLGFAGVTGALFYALEGWQRANQERDRADHERRQAESERETARQERGSALAARASEASQRARAETLVAFSRLAQARLEWRLNHLSTSEALLAQVEPARRGWEWHHLRALHHGELLTLSRPTQVVVHGLAFSPDGRFLAAAGGNPYDRSRQGGRHQQVRPGEAAIWEATTGRLVYSLGGFRHVATRLAYSPDGRRLAVGSSDGRLRLFATDTGKRLADGKFVAAAGAGGRAVVWQADSGKVVARLHEGNGSVQRKKIGYYYPALRTRDNRPVTCLALYLYVGLQGLGWDKYVEQEDTEGGSEELYGVRWRYVALPALPAEPATASCCSSTAPRRTCHSKGNSKPSISA